MNGVALQWLGMQHASLRATVWSIIWRNMKKYFLDCLQCFWRVSSVLFHSTTMSISFPDAAPLEMICSNAVRLFKVVWNCSELLVFFFFIFSDSQIMMGCSVVLLSSSLLRTHCCYLPPRTLPNLVCPLVNPLGESGISCICEYRALGIFANFPADSDKA